MEPLGLCEPQTYLELGSWGPGWLSLLGGFGVALGKWPTLSLCYSSVDWAWLQTPVGSLLGDEAWGPP